MTLCNQVVHTQLAGLYVITDRHLLVGQIADKVELAIQGGAKLVQYRDKTRDDARRYQEATEILAICHKYRIPLLINDDIQLAAALGADGVHIGEKDASYEKARSLLGPHAIIGVSCYNRLESALRAERQGANYVAFGRFFPSKTKPQAIRADIQLLKNARQQLKCPIVAIGGIHAKNGKALIRAGADMLAVIQTVFATQDTFNNAQAMSCLFH